MADAQTFAEQWRSKLGSEQEGRGKTFYLVTLSHLLGETAAVGELKDLGNVTRKQVADAVKLAFNDPLPPRGGGGRPRVAQGGIVRKLVVFLETHMDGTKHFHVAVLLAVQARWAIVKRTLRERNKLAAHFSCSHDGWWSVLRYGTDWRCFFYYFTKANFGHPPPRVTSPPPPTP